MNNPLVTHTTNPLVTDVVAILEQCPFLYEIAMYHRYVEDEATIFGGHPTMACDGRSVYYHPDVLKWRASQRRAVIVHEWMHTGHMHHPRLLSIPDGNAEVWNIAADAVINPMVEAFGFKFEGGVRIPGAEKKSAEEVYRDLLRGGNKPKMKPGPGMPGPMKPGPGMGNPSDDGEAIEAKTETTAEAESKSLLARMVQGARIAGKLPAGLEQQVKDWLKPKVDWRAVLREHFTRINRDSWSYARSNRSYACRGVCVPGRYSKNAGDMVIVRDTSGSLYGKQQEVASETWGIIQELRPRRTLVIDCDAAVHRTIELRPGDPLPQNTLGGGGTDFRPAFKSVEKMGYEPEVMVFITDLEGVLPDKIPDYPVIWALIGGRTAPPWGRSVVIE